VGVGGSGLPGGELQCQAINKRPLEAANSMPILTIQPDCLDKESLDFGDVEIEVEDERKYLPTDLFIDQHEKLCSTKSHNGNWTTGKWEEEDRTHDTNVLSVNGSMAVRKTTSLNPEGFNLFSDQLDLLSSVRSNWNKNTSCSSSEASGSTGFEETAIGSTGFEEAGSTGFEDKQKDFESALENLTQEMGSILLRKI